MAKAAPHPSLWATVNLCDTPSKPGAVGVRVSIPREKGAPQQWARIRLQWFDGTKRAWRLVRSGRRRRLRAHRHRHAAGAGRHDVHLPAAQARRRASSCAGSSTSSGAPAPEVVDHARMNTTAGHRDGKDRQRRVSRSSCEITR